MAKSKTAQSSRIIVVDCGIAHAAGPEGASHPTSKHCRDFLVSMQKASHRLGWSSAVAEEWKRHRSRFSRKWLVSMQARRLVESISANQDAALRAALETSNPEYNACVAMEKDAHLLEAAIHSGNCVASLDEVVRRLFVSASILYEPIRGIAWVNPDTKHDSAVNWLLAGAPLHSDSEFGDWLLK